MGFERIDPKQTEENVFRRIGDDWMLVTAGNRAGFNTMTASWGTLGVLWNRPVAMIFLRPQRYTREFLETSDGFTLSFFPEGYRKTLALCGSKSGRDSDKVREAGLTPVFSEEGRVFFAQAERVLLCKKLYYQDLDPAHFLDPAVSEFYPGGDYHRMYAGEITGILLRRAEVL